MKLLRLLRRHPYLLGIAAGWLRRAVRRCGGVRAVPPGRPRPVTFVMHSSMDAAEVAPAWELTQRGLTSDGAGTGRRRASNI